MHGVGVGAGVDVEFAVHVESDVRVEALGEERGVEEALEVRRGGRGQMVQDQRQELCRQRGQQVLRLGRGRALLEGDRGSDLALRPASGCRGGRRRRWPRVPYGHPGRRLTTRRHSSSSRWRRGWNEGNQRVIGTLMSISKFQELSGAKPSLFSFFPDLDSLPPAYGKLNLLSFCFACCCLLWLSASHAPAVPGLVSSLFFFLAKATAVPFSRPCVYPPALLDFNIALHRPE